MCCATRFKSFQKKFFFNSPKILKKVFKRKNQSTMVTIFFNSLNEKGMFVWGPRGTILSNILEIEIFFSEKMNRKLTMC